jgi:hypothetical protein
MKRTYSVVAFGLILLASAVVLAEDVTRTNAVTDATAARRASTSSPLRPGMTFLEVEQVLGAPDWKASYKEATRWEYKRFTVVFKNGRVASVFDHEAVPAQPEPAAPAQPEPPAEPAQAEPPAAPAAAVPEAAPRAPQAPAAEANIEGKDVGELSEDEIEAKACPAVNVDFDVDTDKDTHPTPEVPADKSLVYVLRPTMLGHKIQSKLAIDGQWVGVNRGRNYFYVMLGPGPHYFCSKAENTSVLALRTEAGKTYFVEQKIRMGFLKARNKLALMTEREGREELEDCHPSVWEREED